MARNYAKETSYEERPRQVKRREARNRARYGALKKGTVQRGDTKELDHEGYHPTGTLRGIKARVVTRSANRRRQPPHKGYK